MFRGYTISKIIFCVFYISHGRYNFVPFLTYRNLLEMLNWLKNDMKYDYTSLFCSVVEPELSIFGNKLQNIPRI